MAKIDNTVKQNALTDRGTFTTGNALKVMFETLKPQLSDDDLNWLAESGVTASSKALYWKDILEGVAVHVCSDKESRVGYFQEDASLGKLLFEASNAFNEIDALIYIQGESEYLLSKKSV